MDEEPQLDIEDYQPEGKISDGRCLSWDLDRLNEDVGDRGLEGKLTKKMISQLIMALCYAIISGLLVAVQQNPYYVYPPEAGRGLELILSDEEEFECNGDIYYLNNTGPLVGQTGQYYEEGDSLNLGVYFVFAVIGVFIFVLSRLYLGRYNQLLLFVKFKKDEQSGKITPVKLSVAFTILCNMNKLISIQYLDLCGRRAQVTESTAASGDRYFVSLVYLLCWGFTLLWLMCWMLSCGICCMGPKPIMWFRRFVVVATCILLLLWLTTFDPSFDFNLSQPEWALLNIVSWLDVIISGGYDIYLKCNWEK